MSNVVKLYDVMGGVGLFGVVNRVITSFLGLVGGIALLVFVYSGFLYMTAVSEERVKRAKEIMVTATIGITIILFAYVISRVFLSAFVS